VSNSRKKNVISGFIASAGGSTTLQLVSLFVIPLYLELTSQELFGLWLTLGAILGWIKIGDMGIGLALTKRSIEALESNNYDLLCRLAYGAILSTLIFGILVSGTGYLFTEKLVSVFGISGNLENEFIATYHVLLFVAFIRPGFGVFTSLIDAKQHIAFSHIKNTIVTLLSIALTILLLFLDFGIVSFAYGLLFEALLMPFIDIIYLKLIDNRICLYPIKTSKKDIFSLLKFGGPFQVLKIANLVSTSTDNIIIASILGASSVTIYVFTGKLAFLFAVFLVGVLPSILFPSVAQLFELDDKKKIARLYIKLSNLAIRSGLLMGSIYFVINELFVDLWVGPENYGGPELTTIFVIWIILESFIRGITNIIYASGDLHGLTIVSFFEAVLNIILTLYFIETLGLLGVVLGTVLSRVATFFYVPLKINKILEIDNFKYIKELIVSTVFQSMPTLIVVATMNIYMDKTIDPTIQIIIICGAATLINIVSYEGLFLIKQKGVKWKDRVKLLAAHYYSV
jgi:O-antigen/teichoic acid export membrane protein